MLLSGECVNTTSGRKRRISRTISMRSCLVSSSSPSGYPRKTTSLTPSSRQAFLCSSSRILASLSGVISESSVPLLPLVQTTNATSVPSPVQRATVPAQPISSSGWAVTTMALAGRSIIGRSLNKDEQEGYHTVFRLRTHLISLFTKTGCAAATFSSTSAL